MWVAKYDSAGNLLWKRQLPYSTLSYTTGITKDPNNNVYISRYTPVFTPVPYGFIYTGLYDAWVVKYDSNGKLIWKRQFGTDSIDYVSSIATDTYRNVYLAGITEGAFAGFQYQGLQDAWVAKYPQTL